MGPGIPRGEISLRTPDEIARELNREGDKGVLVRGEDVILKKRTSNATGVDVRRTFSPSSIVGQETALDEYHHDRDGSTLEGRGVDPNVRLRVSRDTYDQTKVENDNFESLRNAVPEALYVLNRTWREYAEAKKAFKENRLIDFFADSVSHMGIQSALKRWDEIKNGLEKYDYSFTHLGEKLAKRNGQEQLFNEILGSLNFPLEEMEPNEIEGSNPSDLINRLLNSKAQFTNDRFNSEGGRRSEVFITTFYSALLDAVNKMRDRKGSSFDINRLTRLGLYYEVLTVLMKHEGNRKPYDRHMNTTPQTK